MNIKNCWVSNYGTVVPLDAVVKVTKIKPTPTGTTYHFFIRCSRKFHHDSNETGLLGSEKMLKRQRRALLEALEDFRATHECVTCHKCGTENYVNAEVPIGDSGERTPYP